MSCPTRVSVGCRSGKADLAAVATCSAAGLLRFLKLGSFSSSAQLPPPSLLFLLLWMQAEPLAMHLHGTCCLIAEGVPECGLLQRRKRKKVYFALVFTVPSFSLVPMPWWNWPDSLLPCTGLSLWLWKRSTKRTLVSTAFCSRQMCCSSSRDFYLPLQDVLAKIS